jgi:3-phenylpropionate/cinnamic acid dioxygenase small subunit
VVDHKVLSELDALQVRYTEALDGRNMQAWAACFSSEGSYICLTRESEEQNLPLALMMDDNRDRIEDRVNFVTQVWAGTFEDYTMRHIVQRLAVTQRSDTLYGVKSNFIIAYTTARGKIEILTSGVYRDEISLSPGPAFKSKRAVIDSVTPPRYIVYPL